MALASQTARGSIGRASRGNWSRRKRRRPESVLILVVLGVAVVAGGVWGARAIFGGGPDDAVAGEEAGALAADPTTQEPPPNPTAPLPSAGRSSSPATASNAGTQREPVVLNMGQPLPRSGPTETSPASGTTSQRSPAGGGTEPGASTPLASAPDRSTPPPAEPENRPSAAQTDAASNNPAPAPAPAAGGAPSVVREAMAAAERATKENRLADARHILNRALLDRQTRESDREALRTWIAEINQTLVFSPAVSKDDPLAESYTVQRGDSLVRIASRLGLAADWRLIQRINRMRNPNAIQVGQRLKVLRGPFHAVVHKSSFRLDLYAGDPLSPGAAGTPGFPGGAEPGWVYIRSFHVGLGEHGQTPVGTFVVRKNSKLINPHWVNPRTGERFDADDPRNPIGEHWLGIDGVDDASRGFTGYGLHGTIEPQSIGREMSMGCVRMGAEDIALVWEMLEEGVSTVKILP